jgi:origin recognition complex subunit 3
MDYYSFRDSTQADENRGEVVVPTGFICTGPNIASQSLLFKQLSARLRADVKGPVVNLRSGDASNLKAVLKQIIREATNQAPSDDDEEMSTEKDVSS